MAPALPIPGDDEYDSAADSDFGGSLSPSSGDESSGSDGEDAKGSKPKSKGSKKRSLEDSGDEGVVKEGRKKRRKKAKAAEKEEEGLDESAIGMRVRERKLGRAADQEKKPLASAESSTVDVDALWVRLNTAAPPPPKLESPPHTHGSLDQKQSQTKDSQQSEALLPRHSNGGVQTKEQSTPTQLPGDDTIAIKRTYVFAGETITEEKIVPKSSAEARLYLQSQAAPPSPISPIGGKPLRRPKKRPSMFEPNPEGIVKGIAPTPSKGPKLNVVEKSKLDWASHVDKEGLKDELDVAEKAKDGYMGRMDFLGRSEMKREEERKNARTK
ncbi:MAG: hypothetical protein Q9186_005322 [Xanthomendoza sp. 1 TL-2023]